VPATKNSVTGSFILPSICHASLLIPKKPTTSLLPPEIVVTMNWRRGLFRLWIVGSALFVLAVAFICYSQTKSYAGVPWAKLEMCATIAFGIPLVVLILGWAFSGSAAKRS
jgi:hypothetical protein